VRRGPAADKALAMGREQREGELQCERILIHIFENGICRTPICELVAVSNCGLHEVAHQQLECCVNLDLERQR
jgi:hypothetical protein